jgi:hypothetical protein
MRGGLLAQELVLPDPHAADDGPDEEPGQEDDAVPAHGTSLPPPASGSKFAADASTVTFAVGLVGLGLGTFLWLGDSSVSVSAGVASVAVSGRF